MPVGSPFRDLFRSPCLKLVKLAAQDAGCAQPLLRRLQVSLPQGCASQQQGLSFMVQMGWLPFVGGGPQPICP